MDVIRYPIGKFVVSGEPRNSLISHLHLLPEQLRETVCDLSAQQLDTAYQPDGWTVRQIIHHIADSHLNGYIRFKWALTESSPRIKPYDQDQWAATPEVNAIPPLLSVTLLESLHARWVVLLQSISETDYQRQFKHPDSGVMNLSTALELYVWHGRHHVAQIQSLRHRLNWK